MIARLMPTLETATMLTTLNKLRKATSATLLGVALMASAQAAHARSDTPPTQNVVVNPTISVSYSPAQPVAGQTFRTNWTTASGNYVSYTCTAGGTGLNESGDPGMGTGFVDRIADPRWVNYPSTCEWTADNGVSTGSVIKTLTTVAAAVPAPTVTVSRTPNPMTANQPYTLTWSSTNATYLNRMCTSTGTGFTTNSVMSFQGTENGTASPDWAGYPSNCYWTARNSAGVSVQILEVMTTNPPAPTITVSRTPIPMTANQAYTLNWSTTSAVSVNRVCSASGTGFTSNGAMGLQGPEYGTAAAGWAGYPSTCVWTATNAVGVTAQFTETMTTNPPVPTITVARTPNPMTANQPYTLTWSSTNAVSLNRACTAAGTGFTSNGAMNLQGPENGTASAGWAGYPSTCVWTATNAVGATAQFTETMTTNPPVPTITVSRTPNPMTANQAYTLNWATTNAASLNRACSSTGTGFTSNGAMSLQGPESGTASASWANYPSTCVWTATNSAGATAQFTETMTTNPPIPTITVSRTPTPMTANQAYSLTWSTTNAVSLNRACTSTGTGFTSNGAMSVQGPENGTASAGWAGYPSTCVWTATNSAGATAQFTETMTTNPPVPTITVSRAPNPMTANQAYTLAWSTTNAASLNRVCSSTGTGFTANGAMSLQGPENGTASAGWAGYPSTCVWTATNSAGATAQFTEIMTTKPPVPTITVSRTPNPMTANQAYTLAWSTTNAASLNRVCTSTGTGFVSNGAMSLQGPENGTAAAGWAGYPSTCVWTATNSAGATAQFTETMTTNAPAPAPTITVSRTPNPMTANQAYTLNWTTANAVSLSRACTSTGTGFTSAGAMSLQGPQSGTASASWVGYPSTCVWTATNAAGATAQFTETMTTNAPAAAPTITVSRTPNPMTANAAYTLNWTTTNALSLSRVCTSTGTGFSSNGAMSLQGPQSGTASASWVGYPSTCVWTATNSAGATAQFTESMTTNTAAVAGITYIHTDGLGSPVARTDSTGAIVSVTRYEPYGMTAGGATPTIGFTGHVNDAETGLTYMQQRYYDPVAGRFLSIDPVTTDANTGKSFNRYNYANNNPYKYIDPDGRDPDYNMGAAVGLMGLSKNDERIFLAGEEAAGVFAGNSIKGYETGKAVRELAVEIGGAKTGPKTNGEGPHNQKIAEIGAKIIAAGLDLIAGGGRAKEKLIPTPGGAKSGRRPDVLYRDANGQERGVNVGKVKADGTTPVTREQKALNDLNGPGKLPTTFEKY